MWPHRIPFKKAYESTAYITWPENTVCQLILAASNSLESAEKSYGQVWLAQARLPEDFKKTLRDLSIVPGHLFGPDVSEVLEKRMKLSATTQQLTQVQRTPNFRMPIPPAHRRYTPAQPCFWQPSSRPQGQQRFPGSDEAQIRHPRGGPIPHRSPGGPRQRPPTTSKGRNFKAWNARASGRMFYDTSSKLLGEHSVRPLGLGNSAQRLYSAVPLPAPQVLGSHPNSCDRPDTFCGSLSLSQKKKNSFLVGEESDREGSPLSSKRGVFIQHIFWFQNEMEVSVQF